MYRLYDKNLWQRCRGPFCPVLLGVGGWVEEYRGQWCWQWVSGSCTHTGMAWRHQSSTYNP